MASVQSPDDLLRIEQVAYEAGIRHLAAQEASLTGARNTAGAVATLNGLVATFLGTRVLADNHVAFGVSWMGFSIPEGIAVVALLASVVCVMEVFRPRGGWIFHFLPVRILDQFAFGPKATTLPITYNVLTRFSQRNIDANQKLLAGLYRWLAAAIVLLFVQVLGWLLAGV
jgi:hypothetical protein